MGKFNKIIKNRITKNLSGNPAYKMNPKERLMVSILTSFFNENKFYGDNSERIIEDLKECIKDDAGFVANLAIFARCEMNLRSVSHVIVGELAHMNEGKPFVRDTIKEIVKRVDDMTEIMAYTLGTYGKPIPNSIKKGIRDTFIRFNEYSLAKYNRGGDVKLKDLIFLTHPKGKTEEQEELIKKVIEDRLDIPVTWETELSEKGNKKEVWEKLISERRLGYMATLRNLRNIINAEPGNLEEVYEFISNRDVVVKNKQLPFRYYAAYNRLKQDGVGTSKVYDAIEDALAHSVENINTLKGKTLIACDVSGSMAWTPVSGRSSISFAQIGVLMMAIANNICEESIVRSFDTRLFKNPLSKRGGIIANANSVSISGGGTDITLPLRELIDERIFVDRIIVLSDNEINRGKDTCQRYVDAYRRKVNPKVWVHGIDLQGYGTQQFIGKQTNIIAGWSEKIFNFIERVEAGAGSMIDEIEEYHFKR